MNEPTFLAVDAATILFNLPNYRVVSTTMTADGCRQVIVESEQPPGCPNCGVVATRKKERRFQRSRDIPVARKIEVLWLKYRWYCQELVCERLSFFESTTEVAPRARSTERLRDHLVDAVIRSGRAMSETAAGFKVSWWMVRAAVNEASITSLPNVDELTPRMLGIDEHRFRSVRYFQDQESKTWTRYEPSMSTIIDLDTGQVVGVVDGQDHASIGAWLIQLRCTGALESMSWPLILQQRSSKALRMWLPRTAVAKTTFI